MCSLLYIYSNDLYALTNYKAPPMLLNSIGLRDYDVIIPLKGPLLREEIIDEADAAQSSITVDVGRNNFGGSIQALFKHVARLAQYANMTLHVCSYASSLTQTPLHS